MNRFLTLGLVSGLLMGAGLATPAFAKEEILVGAVGSLKELGEDGKSFEFRTRTIPGSVRVELDEKTDYKSVSAVQLDQVKDGTTLHVLGIPQEAAQRVGPQISGIRAIVMGEFSPPDKLPEELAKIKGLTWISGTLKADGKELKLDDSSLSTGSNRLVAEIKSAKREDVLKPKQAIYASGPFFKKEKGEKEHRIVGKALFSIDRKVPKKEYEYYFFIGAKKKEKSTLDI